MKQDLSDASVIQISPDSMEKLSLFRGDTVKVSYGGKNVFRVVLSDESISNDKMKISEV